MKRLAIICLLLAACTPHLIRRPPPMTIAPKVAPTVSLMPTITPDEVTP